MADALNVGFGTPFEAQIDFLRNKLGLATARWDDIEGRAHDRAFVVAGAAKADLLADLHASLVASADSGKGLEAWRKDFKAIVAKHGWTGWTGEDTPAGVAWRTKVIYQTNMATSYAAGRYKQLSDPDYVRLRPYWRYLHSDGVLHPRPEHLAWHGLTLRHDDPFWLTHFPPCGWGCHCRVTPVSVSEGLASAKAALGEPPKGWDKIDPRTGAQVGIDKGFDYTPGKSLVDELRSLTVTKVQNLPAVLGKALADEVAQVLGRPVFAEAPTAKAAAEWAVKHNLADFADYTGIKPVVANAWNRSLFDHLEEFPELRVNQKFVGTGQAQFGRWLEIARQKYADTLVQRGYSQDDAAYWAEKRVKPKKMDGSTYAQSWAQEDVAGVAVNSKFGRDVVAFEQALVRDVDQEWHPVGCNTIRSVVDHEFGHQLDTLLGLSVDSEAIDAYNLAKLRGMKGSVSGYANKNIGEFIAECWAEACNNPQPREFASTVARVIRARYRSRFAG